MTDLTETFINIMEERKYVGIKPYSHNIISLHLRQVSKEYGQEEANKMIKMCKLEQLGWCIT